ncbi:MAG TPA: restriction endonuclease [Puia sp.]|uniref:restriction endonuclease n=1 Tax=Puia sp. TaxID=2045100 RepID=UPI002CAE4D8B|nr:restriction endonuclease [Puia sp.]HVU95461.1 restriction endonuclease [Puia sp.]
MASTNTFDKESLFVSQLMEQLGILHGVEVRKAPVADYGVDLLVVEPISGKRIAIECKSAGEYGELPISTILPIARLVKDDPSQQVILVSFSSVSNLLSSKLKELKVPALTDPTVKEVVDQVQLALSA